MRSSLQMVETADRVEMALTLRLCPAAAAAVVLTVVRVPMEAAC